MNPSIFSKGWIELVILNIKVGRFFASLKVSLPLTTSRRHRKWKLTRGEESDTDCGGESGGECTESQDMLKAPRDPLGTHKAAGAETK